MVSSARGRFITLEGGEGAGKSTQVKLLATWLGGRGIDVLQTREPGGAPGAERIRELLSRATPIADPIAETPPALRCPRRPSRTHDPPALAVVAAICDRFADSTTAYQGYGHGVPFDVIDSSFKAWWRHGRPISR
jgi:dTMP kinase